MLAVLKEVGALICVPVLLYIAWREWVRNLRALLPPWRNGIVLTALLILSVNWVLAMLLDAPGLFRTHLQLLSDIGWGTYHLAHPIVIVAGMCAFALKHEARLVAVLASMLLLSCWPGGYI